MIKSIYKQNWKLRLPLLNCIFIWLRLILINHIENIIILSISIFVCNVRRSVLLLRLGIILLIIKIIVEILKWFISKIVIIVVVLGSLRIKTSHMFFLNIWDLGSIWRLLWLISNLIEIIPGLYLLLFLNLKFYYVIWLFLFIKVFFFLKFLSVVRNRIDMTFWTILILVLCVKFTFWLAPHWTIFKSVWITHLILYFCRKLN